LTAPVLLSDVFGCRVECAGVRNSVDKGTIMSNIIIIVLSIILILAMILIFRLLKASKAAPVVVYRKPETESCELEQKSEIREMPHEIVVRSSNSDQKDLVFRRVLPAQLGNLESRIQRVDLDNPLNALPTVAVDAGAMLGASALFKATVDPSTLTRFADGSFSTMIHSVGGRIAEHGSFIPVNPAQVFAPLLVFQVASIITGQYYLHGITKQLSAVSEKIQMLINLHHNEKSSMLQSHYEILMSMYDNQHFSPQDLNELRDIYRDANSIRHEYANLLSSIDTSGYKQSMKPIRASKKLEELVRRVAEDCTANYSDMVLCAERTRFTAKLLEFKCNVSLCKSDPERIYGVLQSMSELSEIKESLSQPEWLATASRKLADASDVAGDIWESAKLKSNKEKAHRYGIECVGMVARFKDEQRSLSREASGIVKKVDAEINRPRELLLAVDDEYGVECLQLTGQTSS